MDLTAKEKDMAQFFVEREGEGVLEVLPTVDFLAEGIIDSLDMVALAVHIERKFGKKIDLTDPKVFEAVRKWDSLMGLVAEV